MVQICPLVDSAIHVSHLDFTGVQPRLDVPHRKRHCGVLLVSALCPYQPPHHRFKIFLSKNMNTRNIVLS